MTLGLLGDRQNHGYFLTRKESAKLEEEISKNLEGLGYEI
jgi:hypothetical protein